MTKNQLDYLGLEETKRNNVVVANETNRHNVAVESETHRSNVVNETENNRHNLVTESETNRHNVATENIALDTNAETKRHNIATEKQGKGELKEHIRHNKVTEKQDMRKAGIVADTAKKTAKIAASATKAAASTNAAASKYATDYKFKSEEIQRAWMGIQNAKDRMLKQWEITKNNKTKKSVAKLSSETSKLINKLKLAQEMNLTTKEQDLKLKKIKNDYKLGVQRNSIELLQKAINAYDVFAKQMPETLKGIGAILPW